MFQPTVVKLTGLKYHISSSGDQVLWLRELHALPAEPEP
jgi:hypothetical protein